jgi:Tfp pilus assembly protein PilN
VSDVIGLAVRDDRLDCAVVRRRFGQVRVLGAFSVSTEESPGTALKAKLRDLGVRARRVHVGIPRRRAVVKAIELPAVAGADLRRMVAFELERHLPFPPGDAIFDFAVLAETPGRPVRVLLAACDRRAVERIGELLKDAGLTPRLLDVTLHSLAALDAPDAPSAASESRVLLHLEESEAELVVARGGRPLLSRAFPLPADPDERRQAVATELRRTLGSLDPEDRRLLSEVAFTSDGLTLGAGWTDLPVRTGLRLPPGLDGVTQSAASVAALALALRVPGRGPVRTNLLPEEARPRPFPWPIAATAALALVTLLLGLAIPGVRAIRDEWTLSALQHRAAELQPKVKEVEQLQSAVERAHRDVATLRSFETQGIHALPVLRELTELLPADVWLTNLSIDRKGVELAGFAGGASQLIPLLEASPALERVEFTSPVTKGRDREQFRLKGAWEARPPESPTSPPEGAPDGGAKPVKTPAPPRPPAAP